MQNKILFYLLIPLLFYLFSVKGLKGEEESTKIFYKLKLSSLGFPTAEKEKDAWGINELKLFKNKLYIGYGDAVANTGPTDVIYFDIKNRRFVKEFRVDDEAIYKYQVIDGNLVIPGPDATEDWELGNIYILTENGWIKKRTVTHGIHINELASFDNKWYVATGNYFDFGEDEMFAFGGILCSEDQGNTWKLVYASPTDDKNVFRIGSLIRYKDKLYVFPYAIMGMKKEEIPEEYHDYLSDRYENHYLIFTDDALGPSDVIVFNGKIWRYMDLIQTPNVCFISPFIFKGKLILSLLTGRYVDYLSLKNGLPGNASPSLLAFDGEKTVRLALKYSLIRDVVIKKDRLLLLILKDDDYFIVETQDLEKWRYYSLPQSLRTPRSIEFDGSSFYIGTEGGNIFKSIGMNKLTDLSSLDYDEPLRFFGAAELPRDGKWYWAAITGWEKWGRLTRFSCEIQKANIIYIETENVSSLRIFIPFPEIDNEKPLEVRINNEKVFKDNLDECTELICTKSEGMRWDVEKRVGSAETFQYKKKVIGRAEAELTREGDDPQIGSFVADVLSWIVSADATIIPRSGIRKDLRKGDISLEDIFDLNYRDIIYTFRVKGAELYKMMDFNIKLNEDRRCCISGFNFTYRVVEELGKNNIVEFPVDPSKEFRIATTGYLVRRMLKFLGDEVNCKNSDITMNEAMMRWFQQFGKISSIKPRIKRIE